ncbi:putative aldehyde dehydrogenase YfmT [Campylobacterota bacterium]|nr:putative aldehyde dehydrogenase YfmT [Campylobacterota bacterium]
MEAYGKQFIAGEWRSGSGKSELADINPFTSAELYRYTGANEADVDAAYQAAAKAQKSWGHSSPNEVRAALEKLLATFIASKDEIFAVLAEESGAAFIKASVEFDICLDIIRHSMFFPLRMSGKISPSNTPGKENYIYRNPKGVIGVIAPWNFPFGLAMRSVIPALATGNGVVLKPSTDTPASAMLLGKIIEKTGAFPKGIFSAIAGRGSDIGDAFVKHPIASVISFTGSTEVGRHIGEVAGRHLKDIALELGGNNVMIVLNDANIEKAAKAAAFGAFFHSGQICMSLNRIILTDQIHDRFVEAFVEESKLLKAGDPLEHSNFLGALINRPQLEGVSNLVKGSIAAGAKVALEGKISGNVMTPCILTSVTNTMQTACCEVFGPVASVIKVANEDEAISLANDTEYGLSGSIFTEDLFRGIQIAKRVETGMIHINDQSINDEAHVMFGGVKASGVGHFNDQWVVDKFTNDQWISVQSTHRF